MAFLVAIGLLTNYLWDKYHKPDLEIERGVAYSSGTVKRTTDSLIIEWGLSDLAFHQIVWTARYAATRIALDSAIPENQIVLKLGIRNRGSEAAKGLRFPIVAGVGGTAQMDVNASTRARLEADSARWGPIDVVVIDVLPPGARAIITYTFTVEAPLLHPLGELAAHLQVAVGSSEQAGAIVMPTDLTPVGLLVAEEMRDKPGGSGMQGVLLFPFHQPTSHTVPFGFGTLHFNQAYWTRIGYPPNKQRK